MDRRVDLGSALLIDAAINASETHGLVPAACELSDWGVSAEIVIRVLTEKEKRRSYPQVHEPYDQIMLN
jgi:hypothetical protein